jgi:hypothetical protein
MSPHTVDTYHPKLAATGEEKTRGFHFVESVLGAEYPGVMFGILGGPSCCPENGGAKPFSRVLQVEELLKMAARFPNATT